MRAAGVDACRSGWVAVVLDNGRLAAVLARATLAEIVAACSGARVIGVDMPLGLVPRRTRRQADRAARGGAAGRAAQPGVPDTAGTGLAGGQRTGRHYCCAGP